MTGHDKYYPMPSAIADWLKEAKELHTIFEKHHGADPHWENWYALFLRYRMDGIDKGVAAGWATIDVLQAPAVK